MLAILFFATVIRSAFGFGEALVGVPLLAIIISVDVAAPVVALISVTVAAVVIAYDWHEVRFQSAGRLLFATLFGIPFGLVLLVATSESVVKSLLAVVIIIFSLYALTGGSHYKMNSDRWAWPFGFLAGILGGAYGMNGPPLVMFGGLRRWPPGHFRATLQGYFLPASILIMAGYWWAGLWTQEVNHYYLGSLPAVLFAVFLGRAINRRMSSDRFLIYIHAGLIIIGFLLLIQATGK